MSRLTRQKAIELIKQVPLYRYECELEKHRQSDLFQALNLSIEAMQELQHYKDLEEQGRLIEQKYGHWNIVITTVYHEIYGHAIYRKRIGFCSNCKQEYKGRILDSNYCPNCGAKMATKEEAEAKLAEINKESED